MEFAFGWSSFVCHGLWLLCSPTGGEASQDKSVYWYLSQWKNVHWGLKGHNTGAHFICDNCEEARPTSVKTRFTCADGEQATSEHLTLKRPLLTCVWKPYCSSLWVMLLRDHVMNHKLLLPNRMHNEHKTVKDPVHVECCQETFYLGF